jgi:hypothetical protein
MNQRSCNGYRRLPKPYSVLQSPRGSVVVCGAHLVTDELKTEEAEALAFALNAQHQKVSA